MNCTTACVSGVEIPKFGDNCAEVFRDDCKSKLVFVRCDVVIPTGDDDTKATALETLIAAGTLGASPQLKEFNWGDPQTTDFTFNECTPARPLVTGRELTASDFHAYDEDESGMASLYFDRDFYAAIAAGQFFNIGWTTCSGKLYWAATDRNYTAFMNAVISVFQAEDKSVANKCLEVKKIIIRFIGDPMKEFPKPYLDLSELVDTYPTLKQLYA